MWVILDLISQNYLNMKVVIPNFEDLHDGCKLIKKTYL